MSFLWFRWRTKFSCVTCTPSPSERLLRGYSTIQFRCAAMDWCQYSHIYSKHATARPSTSSYNVVL